MSLKKYRQKRDFARTPEPSGNGKTSQVKRRFVIQKHAASRLHYDFRLELGGTLISWAIPKGLPLVHAEKRLAVRVEDHPVGYLGFEGVIPAGEYGGGTVMVWDQGTFAPTGHTPLKDLQAGKLHVILSGEKLSGEWYLVRIREEENWLVIRGGDDHPAIPRKIADRSVVSGRTMAQITKAQPPATKSSPRNPASPPSGKHKSPSPDHPRPDSWIAPMLAKPVTQPPAGKWMFEIKFDGFRGMAYKSPGRTTVLSRTRQDLSGQFPEVIAALDSLKADQAVIDGEIVALEPDGRSSFQLLQGSGDPGAERPPICYYAFDLLELNGGSLMDRPLEKRKAQLRKILPPQHEVLRFSPVLGRDAGVLLEKLRDHRLEGLIGKRAASAYEPGKRSGTWIKWKFSTEQEFVIGGYTGPTGSRRHFGALLLGYYDGGKLCYAGKAGSGFSDTQLSGLAARMQACASRKCPFDPPPAVSRGRYGQGFTNADLQACHWLKPHLVARIRFSEWTKDGRLRHPVFAGLREDKPAGKVVRETPLAS